VRIVFFGTPHFAAALLEHIVTNSSHEIVAVVSKPDAPSGRHQIVKETPVKEVAKRLLPSVPLIQLEKISSKEGVERLCSIEADLYWVVAYGELISLAILGIPKLGCFNVHASLLPQYRGAAPIQRALLDGCTKTGISIFRLTKGMDSGDVIWQQSVSISENTMEQELTEKLLEIAKKGSLECFDALSSNTVTYAPQLHEEATFAPKIDPSERVLNPSEDIVDLHNRVRALSGNPGVHFSVMYKGSNMRLKIIQTHLLEDLREPVRRFVQLSDGKLGLQTPEGTLVFDLIQLQSRSMMSSDQFLRGIPLSELLIT
jgi:methionyl-tRNA formyltransferase